MVSVVSVLHHLVCLAFTTLTSSFFLLFFSHLVASCLRMRLFCVCCLHPALQPAVLYRDQIRQLQDMGFTDAAANIRALTATGGDVAAAVNLLLSGI